MFNEWKNYSVCEEFNDCVADIVLCNAYMLYSRRWLNSGHCLALYCSVTDLDQQPDGPVVEREVCSFDDWAENVNTDIRWQTPTQCIHTSFKLSPHLPAEWIPSISQSRPFSGKSFISAQGQFIICYLLWTIFLCTKCKIVNNFFSILYQGKTLGLYTRWWYSLIHHVPSQW